MKTMSTVLLHVFTLIFAICGLYVMHAASSAAVQFVYHSESVKRPTMLELPNYKPVKMYIQNTVRYQVDSETGAEDFARLLPLGGHVVHLDGKDYTVAMFHQLRCLDIIREDYASGQESPYREHCFNYLRQSILCLADLRLESVRSPFSSTRVVRYFDNICRDWTALYAAAEKHTPALL